MLDLERLGVQMSTSTSNDFRDQYGWDGALLDLESYCQRIGYDGPREPTLATLRALMRAHASTIPFENIDVLLGRELLLDVASLHDKMVTRHRGGHCYEHNTLFAAVLERLGFPLTAVGARIMHSPDPEKLRAINHSALLVSIGQRRYVVDVGMGMGPEEPVELSDGEVITAESGWIYGVEQLNEHQWALRYWDGRQWVYMNQFALTPVYRVDYHDGNFVTQYRPYSPFRKSFVVGMSHEGQHCDLTGLTFSRTNPDGTKDSRTVTPKDIPDLLVEVFGIALTEDEKPKLVSVAQDTAEQAHTDG